MTSDRTIEFATRLPVSAEAAYAWHARPGAMARLMPPWDDTEIVEAAPSLEAGSRAVLRIRMAPLRRTWVAEHEEPIPGRRFEDVQVSGPFAAWHHVHEFEPDGDDACVLTDRITYRLPLGALGAAVAGGFTTRQLEALFDHRHRTTARDLRRHADTPPGKQAMKIAVSGSSGLIGSALAPFLTTGGHDVVHLVRRETEAADEVSWYPDGRTDGARLEGVDAVVHLAGAGIADKRWTPNRKQEIRDSRVRGTRGLCEALAKMERKPSVLVCASAIGFYGDRGHTQTVHEGIERGAGFLADVVQEWEEATRPAREAGIRVVNARFGIVLSPDGGALAKMLLPFKLGVGGPMGTGRQIMSWVSLDDAVGALHHALVDDSIEGPMNVVAPSPVSNADFGRTLGRVLVRPAFLPMPGFAAKLAFGELADALLLSGVRVEPRVLERTGYEFAHPDLEQALRALLGKPKRGAVEPVKGRASAAHV